MKAKATAMKHGKTNDPKEIDDRLPRVLLVALHTFADEFEKAHALVPHRPTDSQAIESQQRI